MTVKEIQKLINELYEVKRRLDVHSRIGYDSRIGQVIEVINEVGADLVGELKQGTFNRGAE